MGTIWSLLRRKFISDRALPRVLPSRLISPPQAAGALVNVHARALPRRARLTHRRGSVLAIVSGTKPGPSQDQVGRRPGRGISPWQTARCPLVDFAQTSFRHNPPARRVAMSLRYLEELLPLRVASFTRKYTVESRIFRLWLCVLLY